MKQVGQLKKLQFLRTQKHKASLARMAKTQFEIDAIKEDIETTKAEREELRRNGRKTLQDAIEHAQQGYASSSKIINISVTLNRHTRQLTDNSGRIRKLTDRQHSVEQELSQRRGDYVKSFRELEKANEIVTRTTGALTAKAELADEDELSEIQSRQQWGA